MTPECRMPLFDATGHEWATKSAGPHDWRLLSREPLVTEGKVEYIPQEGAPGFGSVTVEAGEITGWKETWYCTRCRFVDEREVVKPQTKEEEA